MPHYLLCMKFNHEQMHLCLSQAQIMSFNCLLVVTITNNGIGLSQLKCFAWTSAVWWYELELNGKLCLILVFSYLMWNFLCNCKALKFIGAGGWGKFTGLYSGKWTKNRPKKGIFTVNETLQDLYVSYKVLETVVRKGNIKAENYRMVKESEKGMGVKGLLSCSLF